MRKVTVEEKERTFDNELKLIFSDTVREFTRLCIISAPDYIFGECPSSSSGKYHPIDEMSGVGTIIHTKRVFTVAYELCRGLDCEKNRCAILSACLLHDLVKQAWKCVGHTVKNHPDLAACLVGRVQKDTQLLDDKVYNIIRNSVGYHYGPWSINPWKKPMSEYTPEELCVYMSDYVASKRCIEVKYIK